MLPSRGVTSQMRHLVTDLEALMPHCKKGEALEERQLAVQPRLSRILVPQIRSWTRSLTCTYSMS